MDDKQEDLMKLIDLFNSRPNFSHHCEESKMTEDSRTFLQEFSRHFCTVHNGFLSLRSLLEDTLVQLQTKGGQHTVVPFKLSMLRTKKNLIIRCG
jgi:hypothetical protein